MQSCAKHLDVRSLSIITQHWIETGTNSIIDITHIHREVTVSSSQTKLVLASRYLVCRRSTTVPAAQWVCQYQSWGRGHTASRDTSTLTWQKGKTWWKSANLPSLSPSVSLLIFVLSILVFTMSYVSSYKSNGSLMSINLFFYPDVSGAGTSVNVIKPSDTVTLCELAVIWSAQIAIHNSPVLWSVPIVRSTAILP